MTTSSPTSEKRSDRVASTKVCPTCGKTGRQVDRVTLEHLVLPNRRGDIDDALHYVCATPRCETVYFVGRHAKTFRKSDLTVRFGQKEIDAPRPVCYCFDHTIEEIHDEIHRTGESTIADSIRAEMKGPGCRCEYTNPLGGCCLAAVQAAVADAFRSIGNERQAATGGPAGQCGRCTGNGHTPNGPDNSVALIARSTPPRPLGAIRRPHQTHSGLPLRGKPLST